jgi:hypothetical protein
MIIIQQIRSFGKNGVTRIRSTASNYRYIKRAPRHPIAAAFSSSGPPTCGSVCVIASSRLVWASPWRYPAAKLGGEYFEIGFSDDRRFIT